MASLLSRLTSVFSRPTTRATPDGLAAGYRIFTRAYDVEVDAGELATVLGPTPAVERLAHEDAWSAFSTALNGWRTRASLRALEASTRIRNRLQAAELAETAVAILVDQSGSMRGTSMLLAAAACDVAQDFVAHLGATVEILGFTTMAWKGGQARQRWIRRGMPANPGRLCDLLHIIYRRSDDGRASTGGSMFKPMLRPDLPKENVDGEAVLWASARLRAQPQAHKVLVVLSDGAPVDDSTLQANDPGYLDRHLREVLASLAAAGDIEVYGVGIGFDPSRYYARATLVATPEDLGEALIGALETAIGEPRGHRGCPQQ